MQISLKFKKPKLKPTPAQQFKIYFPHAVHVPTTQISAPTVIVTNKFATPEAPDELSALLREYWDVRRQLTASCARGTSLESQLGVIHSQLNIHNGKSISQPPRYVLTELYTSRHVRTSSKSWGWVRTRAHEAWGRWADSWRCTAGMHQALSRPGVATDIWTARHYSLILSRISRHAFECESIVIYIRSPCFNIVISGDEHRRNPLERNAVWGRGNVLWEIYLPNEMAERL